MPAVSAKTTISSWRNERNARSLARLERSLPDVFPAGVRIHAFALPLLPATPRRCIESYWRHHVVRADRLARALAAREGAPPAWRWRLGGHDGGSPSFRQPPAPFREKAYARGPGYCCICGQPVFRFGWHSDLWGDGKPNARASWHACCVAAWKLWTQPSEHLRALKRLQLRRCAATGTRLLRTAEVDHRQPLYRVWRDHNDLAWPQLLAFWGVPNLQVINRTAHVAKCAAETDERASVIRAGLARAAMAPEASATAGRTVV
jgi:hypothetical protein